GAGVPPVAWGCSVIAPPVQRRGAQGRHASDTLVIGTQATLYRAHRPPPRRWSGPFAGGWGRGPQPTCVSAGGTVAAPGRRGRRLRQPPRTGQAGRDGAGGSGGPRGRAAGVSTQSGARGRAHTWARRTPAATPPPSGPRSRLSGTRPPDPRWGRRRQGARTQASGRTAGLATPRPWPGQGVCQCALLASAASARRTRPCSTWNTAGVQPLAASPAGTSVPVTKTWAPLARRRASRRPWW